MVYVRNDVKYDRRGYLENDTDAMCWIDVKMEGKMKITCGFIYIKFHLWGQPESRGIDEQRKIWIRIVNNWLRGDEKRDMIVMIDLNKDYNEWRMALRQKGD